VLEVDGEKLFQSMAILRYCGDLAGLTPRNRFERAKVDAFVDALDDVYKPIMPTFFMPDGEEKVKRTT
jgi:glutathione S-transferase